MTTPHERYHARMQRVLDHIDRHLDGDLGLETLSAVAAFSKFHFQRQFAAMFGISVDRYVRLARMKRASYRLAFREGSRVTDVALDSGYDAPDAFARAFRRAFGQAPAAFRTDPDWGPWFQALAPLEQARTTLMHSFTNDDVTLVTVADMPVARLIHRGDPKRIGESIRAFIDWRRANGLSPRVSRTFTVFHANPADVAPEDFRMDLCVSTDAAVAPNDAGVEAAVIPGGRCATLRAVGARFDAAALFLYRDWLPTSGEEPRDFPFYCERKLFFPDMPEHEAVNDLYLPLAG